MIIKAADDLPLSDRIRSHMLAVALVAVSQGIAFFHAGDELLRSKSLDRDSYNSGVTSFRVYILASVCCRQCTQCWEDDTVSESVTH